MMKGRDQLEGKWCIKWLCRRGNGLDFVNRFELSVKVEGTSRWIRMADQMWTVRGGKGQQSWLEMKLLIFQCLAIPLSYCLQQGYRGAVGFVLEKYYGSVRG